MTNKDTTTTKPAESKNTNENTKEVKNSKSDFLKQLLKSASVEFSSDATEEDLQNLINTKLTVKDEPVLTATETKNKLRTDIQAKALKLVRVLVTCNNPNKRDYKGEIFTVSNKHIGVQRKFVPFNAEGGYHIPVIMFNAIKERKYQHVATKKDPKNPAHIIVTPSFLPEFTVTVLPDLTEEELKELGDKQDATSRLVTE